MNKIFFKKKNAEKIKKIIFLKNIDRDLFEKEIKDFLMNNQNNYKEKLILWDGYCDVCEKKLKKPCSYIDNLPCRYPEEIKYSMEAVGVNVDATVKKLGFNLEWPPTNYLYRFGLVCLKS